MFHVFYILERYIQNRGERPVHQSISYLYLRQYYWHCASVNILLIHSIYCKQIKRKINWRATRKMRKISKRWLKRKILWERNNSIDKLSYFNTFRIIDIPMEFLRHGGCLGNPTIYMAELLPPVKPIYLS